MSSDCTDEGNDGYKSLTHFEFEELMNEVGMFWNEVDYLVYKYPGEDEPCHKEIYWAVYKDYDTWNK